MSLKVGDKVKFNRDTFVFSERDTPELLEVVAQGIEGTVIKTEGVNWSFPIDIEFPFPSPWQDKTNNRLMIVRADESELIPLSDSDNIETLLEPLVKAYGL